MEIPLKIETRHREITHSYLTQLTPLRAHSSFSGRLPLFENMISLTYSNKPVTDGELTFNLSSASWYYSSYKYTIISWYMLRTDTTGNTESKSYKHYKTHNTIPRHTPHRLHNKAYTRNKPQSYVDTRYWYYMYEDFLKRSVSRNIIIELIKCKDT